MIFTEEVYINVKAVLPGGKLGVDVDILRGHRCSCLHAVKVGIDVDAALGLQSGRPDGFV
jgi:hypothetical protein